MDKFKSIDEALNITDSEIVPTKKDAIKKEEMAKKVQKLKTAKTQKTSKIFS